VDPFVAKRNGFILLAELKGLPQGRPARCSILQYANDLAIYAAPLTMLLEIFSELLTQVSMVFFPGDWALNIGG
jgi:hypothetical protein